jgi:hypothetical protein
MKLSYKQNVYSQTSTHHLLKDIISDVRNDISIKEIVDEIRNEPDKDKRAELKKKLPSFFVDVVFRDNKNSLTKSNDYSSTGIIQFDIDDYDEDKSRERIKKIVQHPSTIYCFLSPSNGIKFGVLTDFICSDENLSQKHKIGYEITKEELKELLDGIELDTATSSVSQQCLVSSDSNAYFNEHPTKLEINNQVSKSYEEQQKVVSTISTQYKGTEDKEVFEALKYIPNYLRYKEREVINLSLIDYFGSGAKSVLMNHWNKSDRKKLEKQIDGYIKSHLSRGGNKITIKSLFSIAWKNGYRGNQVLQTTTEEPTYYSDNYYSPDESNKQLEKIILTDFFEDKKDKMVLVECGSGKTRTMFQIISKFLFSNPNKKVSVFLKTHEMMDQFVDEMNKHINEHNEGDYKKRFPFYHRPHRIKGMGESCKELDRPDSGITKQNLDVVGTSKCDDCYFRNIETCEYFEQYENYYGIQSNVRIYTHNRLFLKPKVDKDFSPDYVVIDEDIVSMMTDTQSVLLTIGVSQEYQSINKVIENVRDSQTLLDSTSNLGDELNKDYESVKNRIENKILELKKIDRKSIGVEPSISKFRKLQKELELLEKYKGLFEELLLLSSGTKTQSSEVWIQYRDTGLLLIYGKTKKILSEFDDVPVLYMDASGEEKVIDSLFDRNFEFENIRVEQQSNSKVYQFVEKSSFSKQSFALGGKKVDEILNWVDTLETKKIGMIRYKQINQQEEFLKGLDEKINQINGNEDYIGWFGNLRGINRFEDCDTLLVIGQHRLPDYEIFNRSQLIFREDIQGVFVGKKMEDNKKYSLKEKQEKVYRMKNGDHKLVEQDDYINPECYFTSNHFDKSETYQALHRLRLIHGNKDKQVYLLTDCVVDVSIDELLGRFKEFNEKNIQVIKYLKENKFLIDSTESFSENLKWTTNESSTFREARSSGNWMKNHRSLDYWKYQTKIRKTGKIYTWKNQTDFQVMEYLINEGLNISKLELT